MTPQQQQQYASLAAGMGAAFLFFGLLVTAFLVFLFWRSFNKAGLSGPLALLALIPGVGFSLLFAFWRSAIGKSCPQQAAMVPTFVGIHPQTFRPADHRSHRT